MFAQVAFRLLTRSVGMLLVVALPFAAQAQEQDSQEAWTFVSFPDFFNFDVPNPWPQWDDSVDWFLQQVTAEDPAFVLIAGDMVNGHWWEGPRCVEQMGALYYSDWIQRLRKHELTFYTAIGDHELGDDPWPPEKAELVPHFERVFNQHMQMPQNGPEHKKGLAYYVLHNNSLFITVETFEMVDHNLHAQVTGEQLAWFKQVIADHPNVDHIIVQGHVPIFGEINSRSSSRLMLEQGKDSAFWQAMKEAEVDLYLCGEHHAVTVLESDGIWQLVHGSSWGRQVVDTMDYLVCDVTPDALRLQMKSFPMEAQGEPMWNLHKNRGPREIVEIPQAAKAAGPQVIGTLTIRKADGGKRYENRSGVFAP